MEKKNKINMLLDQLDQTDDSFLDSLWQSVIRPPKDKYSFVDLGPIEFNIYGKDYTRKDYKILGRQGNILQCSFYEISERCRDSISRPVIIYLHGNSSSQIEVQNYLNYILNSNINVFAFDFSGCGKSEGDYISLGFFEIIDVKIVVDFVYKLPNVGKIGIWGHSMGAATAISYAASDPRVVCLCCDSPFADFDILSREIANEKIKVPEFVFGKFYNLVKEMVYNRNKLEISKLKPINEVKKIKKPIYFVHSVTDEIISYKHSVDLFEFCPSDFKFISMCKGTHDSIRHEKIINKVLDFFKKYLIKDKNKKKD